jgi:predicted nucleic acid-binding protein
MKKLVLDASVVLKWFLPDEELGQNALDILNNYVDGELELMEPSILPYEILNGLLVAERRGRISQKVTNEAFYAFLELGIQFHDTYVDFSEILPFARSSQRSVYDASYMALAKKKDIDFVTGDKRLHNAVKGTLEWVRWLGNTDTP